MTHQVMDLEQHSPHRGGMLTSATLPRRSDSTESALRRVLLTNATTSGLGGLAAVVAGGPVADLLGVDRVGWVRVTGAGLVAFAAFVTWIARSPRTLLAKEAPVISVGDVTWVAGTVVTIALGWYSRAGAIVMGVVGAMVGAFAATQAVLARRLCADD